MFKIADGKITADEAFTLTIHSRQILEQNLKEYTIMAYGVVKCKYDEYTLTLGSTLVTIPSSVVEDGNFTILKYDAGAVFSKSNAMLMDTSYNEEFFSMFTQGYFNTQIAYEDTDTVITGIVDNNQHLDAPAILYELMASTAFRSDKNPSKYYRQTDMKGDYIAMSSRELVSQSNTTSAAVFEDPLTMTMINITRDDKDNRDSTLEKYMKL